MIDLVIPVYNEEHALSDSVGKVHEFLSTGFPYPWRIIIADNASTDTTLQVAGRLAGEYERVSVAHIPQKGRGRALRAVWLESDAEVVSYMDVDLSTDISSYPALIEAIVKDGWDLATGTRLSNGSQTRRSVKRETLSRGYNLMIKAVFGTQFGDAQCGFKALSRRSVRELVPLVQDNEWFFDTELLILAEKKGYRVKDIPVRWVEDPDSRVKLARTVAQDLKGLWRLWCDRPWEAGP